MNQIRLAWLGLLCVALLGCDAPPAANQPSTTDTPSAKDAAKESDASDQRPAAAGVGRQGQGYGGGLISEPIRQRFLIEQRLTFEVQIKQALSLYKAQNPRGRAPATDEEFMREIIQANHIKLPELPIGERYVFDPATEQLMVERTSGGNRASSVKSE